MGVRPRYKFLLIAGFYITYVTYIIVFEFHSSYKVMKRSNYEE